jgi:cytochrome c553
MPRSRTRRPPSHRNGVDAQLMKKPVAQLTDDDIVALAAYLGSLMP